jgi:SAM-dependent methyltransferase
LAGNHSPGARADLAVGQGLAQRAPFFGSVAAADRFVDLAVRPLLPRWSRLSRRLDYADFGGGEGILATAVASALASARVPAEVTVIDENPVFLERARARGLNTITGSLQRLEGVAADLGTLRFVNHYNSIEGQREILRALCAATRPGGILICQIHTASAVVCELFGRIASLLDRMIVGGEAAAAELRHWVTIDVFKGMLEEAGFKILEVIGQELGDEAQVETLLDEAWSRYCGSLLRSALISSDTSSAVRILEGRDRFLRTAQGYTENALSGLNLDEVSRGLLAAGRVVASHPIVIADR